YANEFSLSFSTVLRPQDIVEAHAAHDTPARRHQLGNPGSEAPLVATRGAGTGALGSACDGPGYGLSQPQAAGCGGRGEGHRIAGREPALRGSDIRAPSPFFVHQLSSDLRRRRLSGELAPAGTARLHRRGSRRDAVRAVLGLRKTGSSRRPMIRLERLRFAYDGSGD